MVVGLSLTRIHRIFDYTKTHSLGLYCHVSVSDERNLRLTISALWQIAARLGCSIRSWLVSLMSRSTNRSRGPN